MANLKKEVMSLISRFDAAQEAFTANSVELKKITKKHKKELKAAKAETRAALVEVEALKAELAILKAGGPPKRSSESTEKTAATAKPAAKKRGPGRPKKSSTAKAKPAAKKRGPGRPKKSATASVTEAEAATEAPAKKTTSRKRKGPGRPRTKPAAPVSALQAIKGVGPAMAAQFEAAGVKTPAAMAKLSNTKMADILAKCGPRYRNADSAKMQTYRDAAKAAK